MCDALRNVHTAQSNRVHFEFHSNDFQNHIRIQIKSTEYTVLLRVIPSTLSTAISE